MVAEPRYRRVLLKLSGEALLGDQPFGIDNKFVDRLAGEVAEVTAGGIGLGIVIGGGNIFRGITVSQDGGNRVAADHMGMLATVMNAVALHQGLERQGVPGRIFSAIPVPTVCETFTQQRAEKALAEGMVAVFAGGTGNPYFTTDSGAALRAAEMGCQAILKGTNVDGIYSADPNVDADAVRYDELTYSEMLARGLAVMDSAAVALARDNRIPIIVFSIQEPGALVDVLLGRGGRATTVAGD